MSIYFILSTAFLASLALYAPHFAQEWRWFWGCTRSGRGETAEG